METIAVAVAGACGRMGSEVVRTILEHPHLQLVAAIDVVHVGEDIGPIVGGEPLGVQVCSKSELGAALLESGAQVLVDFTRPHELLGNIQVGAQSGVDLVVGTTGLSEPEIEGVRQLAAKYNIRAIIAPNFALGAILMMRFAVEAAKYLPSVEIIELHHDQKVDAPSGTAIKTAELITAARQAGPPTLAQEMEKIKGARGGDLEGVRIHSIRLPGLVAHQEVLFGGEGQTLSIRHDSLNRKSFMPGVVLAIEKVRQISGVVYGLENLL